jgi:DNA-binding transcriptional LysR family regulator
MNLQHFEALYWIGRLGSFHAAARHLKTSQPAISGRIRDLERELGVTLFDRAQRKAKLTPKGYDLLQYAAQIIGIAEEIRRRVGERETIAGRVRMGVTGMAAMTWVRSLVRSLEQTHPDITIELMVETSEIMAEHLDAGELDLAVIAGPLEATKIASEKLGSVPMSWLASPSLRLPQRVLTPAEIAVHPIISGRAGTSLHTAAMAWFRSGDCEPLRHHACSSLDVRIQLAAQGLGIAIAAASAAKRELRNGSLTLLETDRPVPPIEYFIAHPSFGLSPAARIVAEGSRLLIAQKPNLEAYYSAAERLIQWNGDIITSIDADNDSLSDDIDLDHCRITA